MSPVKRVTLAEFIFSLLCATGILLCILEPVFKTTICHTEGCRMATESLRLRYSLNFLGAAVFTILLVVNLTEKSEKIVSFLLAGILSGEGLLVGYQIFILRTTCQFCITIAAIFLALSLLKLLTVPQEKTALVPGFLGFISVMSLFSLLTPPKPCIPQKYKLLLFYNKNCPHCREIINECRECNIQVHPLPATQYSPLLKGIGVENIPVLFVNGSHEKKILVGKTAIKEYLKTLNPTHLLGKTPSLSQHLKHFITPEAQAGETCNLNKPCEEE